MPRPTPAPFLAAFLAVCSSGAGAAPDPMDTALMLLRHHKIVLNEVGAMSDLRSLRTDTLADPAASGKFPPVKGGYRRRFHAGPSGPGAMAFAYTALPEQQGETGIHGFCTDASGLDCYTEDGAAPVVEPGRCAASCKPLETGIPRPELRLSESDRSALLAALENDPRFRGQPALREAVQALVQGYSPAPVTDAPPGRAHAQYVAALAFTPDGRTLLSASPGASEIKAWSVPDGRLLRTVKGCAALSMLVTPDGATAVTSCDDAVKLWSLPDWRPGAGLDGFKTTMIDLALDKNGRTLVASGKGAVVAASLPDARRLAGFDTTPAGGYVLSSTIAFTSGGTFASAGVGQPLRLWSLPAGTPGAPLEDAPPGDISDLAVSADGRHLAAGYSDGTLGLWSLRDRRAVRKWKEHGFPVNAVAFSPDGSRLLSASSDHTVKSWTVPAGGLLKTLRHADEVFAMAVSPAGGLIAAAERSGTVLLWDLDSGAAKGALVDPGLPQP